ncbi:HDIG domain-containing protein [Saccharothrix xinjiangensis]
MSARGPGAARELAGRLLVDLGDRWRHTRAVAARARELSVTVPPGDRDLLVAAAWLHDTGYAATVAATGFHPLDGARHLGRLGWPDRLCALVAHHSGARLLADVVGLVEELDAYPREEGPVADALTYADQTVDSRGNRVTIGQRLVDVLARHGPDSPHARVHHLREPFLLAVAERVEDRLS